MVHSLAIVPRADVRGRAFIDPSTNGVSVGLEGGKERSLQVTTAKGPSPVMQGGAEGVGGSEKCTIMRFTAGVGLISHPSTTR